MRLVYEERGRRCIYDEVLTEQERQELLFIHRSCSVVGYRPCVTSTTLHHLIASNCPGLIVPLIPIRERIRELMESHFDCEFELFVEFTGLISWSRGADIGWHHDSNRPYLKQRDFSAVLYLNDYLDKFTGGLFHFKDGEPQTVEPKAGRLLMYTAEENNIHSLDRVESGERCTFTMWFTRDKTFDEDSAILPRLVSSVQAFSERDSGSSEVNSEHFTEVVRGAKVSTRGRQDTVPVPTVPLPVELSGEVYWVQDDYGFEPMVCKRSPELLQQSPSRAEDGSDRFREAKMRDEESERAARIEVGQAKKAEDAHAGRLNRGSCSVAGNLYTTTVEGFKGPIGNAGGADRFGFDLRWWKLAQMDLTGEYLTCEIGNNNDASLPTSSRGLHLFWKGNKICYRFANLLHALHVASFCDYHFQSGMGSLCSCNMDPADIPPSDETDQIWRRRYNEGGQGGLQEEKNKQESGGGEGRNPGLEKLCDGIETLVGEWERYVLVKWRKLQECLGAWQAVGSIYMPSTTAGNE